MAVYAEPDRDALHVRVADEAFALGGTTPGDSYLVIDKIIDAAQQSGADAVHPGYGFLSENADFAQAVHRRRADLDRPLPAGDHRPRRQGAAPGTSPTKAGAPLVPGTKDPVKDADEVVAFAEEHGLPVAIKAAFGGGGRGLKVARTMEEIPELFDSAVREAVSAFGRGECFVERYLDKPRHVEAQVLADTARQRDRRRHPRLLAAAAQPEAGRGGAGAVPHRRAARAHPRLGQGDLPRGRLPRRRHRRVPRRRRRLDLLPRGQHPAAGRAPGHARRPAASTWSASSSGSPTGETLRITEDPDAARAQHRVPDQRRGRRPQLPARARPGARGWRSRRAPACAGLRRRDRRRGRPARSTRCWPS